MSNFDILLMGSAAHFNLKESSERRRSVAELVNLFYLMMDGMEPYYCLEVGAFDAKFSQRMARSGVRCFAFEANPYNYQRFKDDLAIPNLKYIHSAVSNSVGTISFMIQRSIGGKVLDPVGGNNSIKSRIADDVKYEHINVPCTTLEIFLKDEGLLGQKFSMWIDVEGATSEVLLPSVHLLSDCEAIFIEVEEHQFWNGQWLSWDVKKFLCEQGFVPIARDFETHKQYNVVYVKSELLARDHNVRSALTTYYTRIGKRWA